MRRWLWEYRPELVIIGAGIAVLVLLLTFEGGAR